MHARVGSPLPAVDERTDAVLLYSEMTINVQSAEKIKRTVREAYKILRPTGREYGYVVVPFNSHEKVTGLHGWCIPAQGKDYEVKDKDAVEAALPKVEGSELISDVKAKILHIPAAEPGNIVGYEYEVEEQPMVLQDIWRFQGLAPVRESHYSLQLPPGWEYKTAWLNYPESKPTQAGNQAQWTVNDVKGLRHEEEMPPMSGVSGQMVISFFPASGALANGFSNWEQMGTWYANPDPRASGCDTRDQAKGLGADRNHPLASRPDACGSPVCAARYPVCGHRTGHRGLAASSGWGRFHAQVRRL
jgi:hypothetical protein